jgi:hypothetical protein
MHLLLTRWRCDRPRHSPRLPPAGMAPVALLLLLGLLAACTATPEPRKRTFVGGATQTAREREREVVVGLNPLGALDVCRSTMQPLPPATRVLVSRPETFSREATEMLLRLRDGLADSQWTDLSIELMLTEQPVATREHALAEGRACGALAVLWERRETQLLELELPFPARIPLRYLPFPDICAYGSDVQRLQVMYFTILGTAALQENRYDQAQAHFGLAQAIDLDCLKLPDR